MAPICATQCSEVRPWSGSISPGPISRGSISRWPISARLTSASRCSRTPSLAGADLREADLAGASGLVAAQLGRANLIRAKLPASVSEFPGLKRLEAAIDGVQKVFLLMLVGCAYAGLTIWSTTDDRLLANLVTSPLPIIGTPIPIAEFYLVAPIVLTGVYVYLGVMLRHVWTGVAELPSVFPDGTALDRRLPVWFLAGWLRTRLPGPQPLLTRAESWLSAFLAWWLVPLVLVIFWGRYLPARFLPYTAVHVALLVVATAFGIALYRLAARTLTADPASFDFLRRARGPAAGTLVTAFAFGLLSVLGMYARPGSRFATFAALIRPEAGLFAELRERQLSARPANWKAADGLDPVSGIQLPRSDLRYALARGAFLVKADLQQAIAPEVDLGDAVFEGPGSGERIFGRRISSGSTSAMPTSDPTPPCRSDAPSSRRPA